MPYIFVQSQFGVPLGKKRKCIFLCENHFVSIQTFTTSAPYDDMLLRRCGGYSGMQGQNQREPCVQQEG